MPEGPATGQFAVTVDNPMSDLTDIFRAVVQRPTDHSRRAWCPDRASDTTVGRHFPIRYLEDDGEDILDEFASAGMSFGRRVYVLDILLCIRIFR
jgi:hypothetical protein